MRLEQNTINLMNFLIGQGLMASMEAQDHNVNTITLFSHKLKMKARLILNYGTQRLQVFTYLKMPANKELVSCQMVQNMDQLLVALKLKAAP